ncbi:MAG TPA: tetratricopeptide repeat protein, partial [Oscillospiraceae bacterium]|nr:tetratricopeptide repeat protein [Oscillospiraceae bacterium]
MFRARLQGKHLVFITVLMFVLTGLIITAVIRDGRVQAAHDLEQAAKNGAWDEYLRLLQEQEPNPAEKLYSSATEDAEGAPDWQRDTIYLFPTWTHGGDATGQEVHLDWAIAKLLLLQEHYPDSSWKSHALRDLATYYYALGDYTQAEKYAKAVDDVLLLARIALDRGDYQRALQITEQELQGEANPKMELLYAKGRALLGLGEWEEAKKLFTSLPAAAEAMLAPFLEDEQMIRDNVGHWEQIAQLNLERITTLQNSEGTGQIGGRVLLGGVPLAGVRVYLLDNTVPKNWSSSNEVMTMRQVVSNAEGTFQFKHVLPGKYVLGAAVQLAAVEGYTLQEQQEFTVESGQNVTQELRFVEVALLEEPIGRQEVDGEVEFRWQAVEDAAFYKLWVTSVVDQTGSVSTVLRPQVTANSIRINLTEELKKSPFYPSYGYGSEKLNPHLLFGQIYRGGEFAWYITAHDASGRKISASNGYGATVSEEELPLFKIKGEFSPADRLVWAQEYERAIAAYEASLKNNPQDSHALVMLARIHHFGIRRGEAKPAEAAGYYERLLNVDDTPEARKALAEVYAQLKRNQEAYELYQSLLGTPAADWQLHYELAKVEYQLGRPSAALTRLKQTVTMADGEYLRVYPVALSLLLGDVDSALWFAQQVDEGERYLSLLKAYEAAEYTSSPAVEQAIKTGEFVQAGELLTQKPHDLFLQTLLLYLEGNSAVELREQMLPSFSPGLL